MLRRGYVDAADLQGVFLVEDSPTQVVEMIRRLAEDRARDDSACMNYERYRVDGAVIGAAEEGGSAEE